MNFGLNVRNIIFDYGGVISNGSRKDYIIDRLTQMGVDNTKLEAFFLSNFVKKVARGEVSENELFNRLQILTENVNTSVLRTIFIDSCKPNKEIDSIINILLRKYMMYIISDSLPPFTAYIEDMYKEKFSRMYFSDKLKKRKSEGLFRLVQDINPDIFIDSVYIDDRKNYFDIVELTSSTTIQYDNPSQLYRKLIKLGLLN